MKQQSMFASDSLFEHIIRGGIGIALLWWAIAIADTHTLASLGLGVLILLLFRGCPICWTIGLFETLYLKFAGRRSKTVRE
jgi:hypothetical protein